jgi:hypothetical protein
MDIPMTHASAKGDAKSLPACMSCHGEKAEGKVRFRVWPDPNFGSARDRLRFKALSLIGRLVVRRIEGADQ